MTLKNFVQLAIFNNDLHSLINAPRQLLVFRVDVEHQRERVVEQKLFIGLQTLGNGGPLLVNTLHFVCTERNIIKLLVAQASEQIVKGAFFYHGICVVAE